jgi:hypothetical protein
MEFINFEDVRVNISFFLTLLIIINILYFDFYVFYKFQLTEIKSTFTKICDPFGCLKDTLKNVTDNCNVNILTNDTDSKNNTDNESVNLKYPIEAFPQELLNYCNLNNIEKVNNKDTIIPELDSKKKKEYLRDELNDTNEELNKKLKNKHNIKDQETTIGEALTLITELTSNLSNNKLLKSIANNKNLKAKLNQKR